MPESSMSSAEQEQRTENVFGEDMESVPGVDVEGQRRVAISNSDIGFVDGDITAGNDVAARDSDLGLVRGDIEGEERLFQDVNGATVFGDMDTRRLRSRRSNFEGTIFRSSHLNTVVGDSLTGRNYSKKSFGNLAVTGSVTAEDFDGNNFAVSRWTDSTIPEGVTAFDPGEETKWKAFSDFKQKVKRNADDIHAVPILNPDVDSVTKEEFFELEEELSPIIDQEIGRVKGRENEIGAAMEALRGFNQMPENRMYARALETLSRASEDELDKVSWLTGKFESMEDELGEDFIDTLETGRRVGDDLLDIADSVTPEDENFYTLNLGGEVEALLRGWSSPDVEHLKEDWEDSVLHEGFVSEGGALENAYDELEDEVKQIYTLAEFLDKDFEFETEAWVRNQIERKENGETTDISDTTDVKERLSDELEELQNQKYQWTKEALESLGKYEIIEGLNNEIGFALRTTDTALGDKMVEFQGDEESWSGFANALERNEHYGIHLLRPDTPSEVEKYDDIWELEQEMRNIVESEIGGIEELVESGSEFRENGILGCTKRFADQEEERYAQVIAEALENDEAREDIGEFGKLLGQLEEGQRERVLEELYSDEFGENLGELAQALKYEGFVNSDAEEVQHLLEAGEEYEGLEDLEEVEEQVIDKLENLNYLADFLNQDLDIDMEEVSEEDLTAALEEREGLVLDAIEQVGNYTRPEKFGREFSFSPFISGTERGEHFTEYTANNGWETFVEELEENPELYRGVFALDPELEQMEGLEELREVNEKMEQLIEEEYGSEEGLVERLEDAEDSDSIVERINTFPDLPARVNAQLLSRVLEMPYEDDTNKERVEDFGRSLSKLDEEVRQELYSILASEGDEELLEGEGYGLDVEYSSNSKLGRQLANIGRARDYVNFLDGRESRAIEELLEGRVEDPVEVNDKLREERPEWAEKLEEIYERHEEEIEHVAYLSDVTGENFHYDEVERSKLLNWAFNPNNDKEEIDWNSLEKEVVEKIENQKRSKLETALSQVGREGVEEEYEDALGERPEDIEQVTENELAALRIRRDEAKYDDELREVADIFLQDKDEVYHREENQEWIDRQGWIDRQEWEEGHGSVEGELQDPNLSDVADEEFQPSNAEYDSALRVQVRDEEQEYDEEREKEKRWQDISETLGRLDGAVAEQLDEVEMNKLRGGESELEEKVDLAETVRDELESEELEEYEEEAYNELKDDIRQFHGVEDMLGAVPDELDIVVSPVEDTVRMGHGFGSCLDFDGGSNNYSALTNAVDANKFAMYALDEEGNERARVKAAITKDEEMIYFNTSRYKDIQIDTTRHFTGYMERLADHWGLRDVKHAGEIEGSPQEHVETLVAHDWYGRA